MKTDYRIQPTIFKNVLVGEYFYGSNLALYKKTSPTETLNTGTDVEVGFDMTVKTWPVPAGDDDASTSRREAIKSHLEEDLRKIDARTMWRAVKCIMEYSADQGSPERVKTIEDAADCLHFYGWEYLPTREFLDRCVKAADAIDALGIESTDFLDSNFS